MGVETTSYAVAPMHTGVYPTYQPLYTLWPRITNVNVTSTPFYYGYVQHYVTSPPISRGFIYRGIKVRLTSLCNTHFFLLNSEPTR